MCAAPAVALPTFQAYINGGSAGNLNGEDDTWFSSSSSFSLFVVGAFGAKDTKIQSVTLLLSVPQGQRGTISISSAGDETPIFVSTMGGVAPPGLLNPSKNADTDIRTDVAGLDGYATKDFLPAGVNFNNHYPFQAGVSDFLLFDLSEFFKSEKGLNNYNADNGGSITLDPNAQGEQKEYTVSFTGFSAVHFDVYGYITSVNGGGRIATTWNINPGSHDSTANNVVPAPGALLLGAMGLWGVGFLRGRRLIA
jgi:hypothetical protein